MAVAAGVDGVDPGGERRVPLRMGLSPTADIGLAMVMPSMDALGCAAAVVEAGATFVVAVVAVTAVVGLF